MRFSRGAESLGVPPPPPPEHMRAICVASGSAGLWDHFLLSPWTESSNKLRLEECLVRTAAALRRTSDTSSRSFRAHRGASCAGGWRVSQMNLCRPFRELGEGRDKKY